MGEVKAEDKVWPGDSDEAYPTVFTKIPTQPKKWKPGQLTQEQLEQFFNQGFVIIHDFFDTEKELDPVQKDIENLVDQLANKLYNAGKIKCLYEEFGFFERLTKLEEEFPGANVILHKLGQLPPAVRKLWANPRLLNIMEQLLGTQHIAGNPVWNLRTKTPNNEATTVPWHQDSGYFDNSSYNIMIPTAWIPLLDAKLENGCLQMVKNAHRLGKMARHQCCYGGTWYIMLEEEEMQKTLGVDLEKDVETCPINYGGLILFNNLIPHRSLPNVSSQIRWSLDLRWQRAEDPAGFYGIKHAIEMRREGEENIEINWESFDAIDRHQASAEHLKKDYDEFDVTIQGPWMDKWEIVHMNQHTDAHTKAGSTPTASWHS